MVTGMAFGIDKDGEVEKVMGIASAGTKISAYG